ncbi:hypothetical protein L1049_022465 [Liquidambar formosana]|uniref:RNase H type-1 domain-containing protein n=1 Tax=Liquidambar formosana TaxID=63359 RepID=A0AAP0REI4_LIQFO
MEASPTPDILSLVVDVVHKVDNDGVALFFMILWAIWGNRNMLVFEGVQRGAREIVDMARCLLIDYTNALQDHKATNNSMQIKWHPPPIGSFKANVDGAIFAESRSVGFGVIVRDSAGRVIATASKHSDGDFAVQFVRELGLYSVMIGDNLEVINAINSLETNLTALGLVLDDIQDALIGHFGTITFGHIRRDGNKVAHGLARHAQNVEGSMIWMEEVPCVVKDQYLYELSQCSC